MVLVEKPMNSVYTPSETLVHIQKSIKHFEPIAKVETNPANTNVQVNAYEWKHRLRFVEGMYEYAQYLIGNNYTNLTNSVKYLEDVIKARNQPHRC